MRGLLNSEHRHRCTDETTVSPLLLLSRCIEIPTSHLKALVLLEASLEGASHDHGLAVRDELCLAVGALALHFGHPRSRYDLVSLHCK